MVVMVNAWYDSRWMTLYGSIDCEQVSHIERLYSKRIRTFSLDIMDETKRLMQR